MTLEATHAARHGGTRWAVDGSLPLLLLVEPTMTGGPWDEFVTRTVSTVQVPAFSRDLRGPGVRATIERAVVVERVRGVVVCGEGPGTAVGTAPLPRSSCSPGTSTAVAARAAARARAPRSTHRWKRSAA